MKPPYDELEELYQKSCEGSARRIEEMNILAVEKGDAIRRADEFEAQLATAWEALEFYADSTNGEYAYSFKMKKDMGKRATKALASVPSDKVAGDIEDYNDELVSLIHDIYIGLGIEHKFNINRHEWVELAKAEILSTIHANKSVPDSRKVVVIDREALNTAIDWLGYSLECISTQQVSARNKVGAILQKLQEAVKGK